MRYGDGERESLEEEGDSEPGEPPQGLQGKSEPSESSSMAPPSRARPGSLEWRTNLRNRLPRSAVLGRLLHESARPKLLFKTWRELKPYLQTCLWAGLFDFSFLEMETVNLLTDLSCVSTVLPHRAHLFLPPPPLWWGWSLGLCESGQAHPSPRTLIQVAAL